MTTDRIIVGLDFGTTFTGVAFVHSSTPDAIVVIKQWPGGSNATYDKVPTEISYARDPPRWGNQLKPTEPRLRCIKLRLDQDQKLPDYVSESELNAALSKAGKNPVSCASEFLSAVFNFTMQELKKRYGKTMVETMVENARIDYRLTVPAMWSLAAKSATRTAAKNAGMTKNVVLVSEPVAAACYTLRVMQPNKLEVGDNIVLCDAGGGTVDLLTYKLTGLSPLALKECTVGIGDTCGSAFLNERFEAYVREIIGGTEFAKYQADKPDSWKFARDHFNDRVKHTFGDDHDDEEIEGECTGNEEDEEDVYNIHFPGLDPTTAPPFEDGCLRLSKARVRKIFEPIVSRVIELIQKQVDAVRQKREQVTAILLVGGFSSSPYLFTQVTKHFEKTSATDAASTSDLPILPISVMQPPNAWTAVARGAVLKGLEEGTVSSRCSRFNYGTPYSPKYVEGVHEFKHTFFDKFEGCRRTLSAMRWYVRPGEAVNESEAIRLEYNRTVAGEAIPSGDKLRVHDDLWADDSDEQAIMWDAKTMWRGCRLETDLSEVPKDLWVKKKTPYGEPFWQIHFFLEMRIESAGMEFSMKFGDNTYGSVKATFNHSDADLRG